jgi:hypothetical protein
VFGLGATAALAEDAPGAKSDITIVGNDSGSAHGAGVEQNKPSQGAADEDSAAMPDPGDGGTALLGTPPANDDGVGVQGGAEDEGATGKSTEDLGAPPAQSPQKEGKLPSPSSAY